MKYARDAPKKTTYLVSFHQKATCPIAISDGQALHQQAHRQSCRWWGIRT